MCRSLLDDQVMADVQSNVVDTHTFALDLCSVCHALGRMYVCQGCGFIPMSSVEQIHSLQECNNNRANRTGHNC